MLVYDLYTNQATYVGWHNLLSILPYFISPGCEKHVSFLPAIIIGIGDFIFSFLFSHYLTHNKISRAIHNSNTKYAIARLATQYAIRASFCASILTTIVSYVVDMHYTDVVSLLNAWVFLSSDLVHIHRPSVLYWDALGYWIWPKCN